MGVTGFVPALSVRKAGMMTRDTTCCINGLFILIVFFSHLRNYIPADVYGPGDRILLWAMTNLGQLMVATFLFFSGYGILESIRRKGDDYVYGLPARRIMPYLLDVWIALIPYVCIRIAKHIPLPMEDVLSAMVGWKGIGNSNWYIFAILCLYIATYFCFRMARGRLSLGIAGVTVACALYSKLIIVQGMGTWYYNTIFCYPAGMLFSVVYAYVRNKKLKAAQIEVGAWAVLALAIALFVPLHHLRTTRSIVFNACAIVFVVLVVFALRKMPTNSRPFCWLGERLFFVYIYQRIPMILLSRFAATHTVAYAGACLAITVALAACMPEVHRRIKDYLCEKPHAPREA